jgi:hypothetical protein
VSLDQDKIDGFGPTLYKVLREKLGMAGHALIEHSTLIDHLRQLASTSQKADRARAVQALWYARRRREALVEWKFTISGIDRKLLINWAYAQVQEFFVKA